MAQARPRAEQGVHHHRAEVGHRLQDGSRAGEARRGHPGGPQPGKARQGTQADRARGRALGTGRVRHIPTGGWHRDREHLGAGSRRNGVRRQDPRGRSPRPVHPRPRRQPRRGGRQVQARVRRAPAHQDARVPRRDGCCNSPAQCPIDRRPAYLPHYAPACSNSPPSGPTVCTAISRPSSTGAARGPR